MSLFEHIAATDDASRVEHRKAVVAAAKRFDQQFGSFIKGASSQQDLESRMKLIDSDLQQMIAGVVEEYGSDAKTVEAGVKESFLGGVGDWIGNAAGDVGGAAADAGNAIGDAGHWTGQAAGNTVDALGDAAGWAGNAYADAAEYSGLLPGGDLARNLGNGIDNDPAATQAAPGIAPFQFTQFSSVKEARRPKMCPYHSELTDSSLQAGEPQYAAFSSLVGGPSHCKGGFEGKCNFKPEMVTQEYWDGKKQEADARREQRELERQQQEEINSIPEADEAAPLEDGTGITELDSDLADAPSAVGEQSLEDNAPLEPMALTAGFDPEDASLLSDEDIVDELQALSQGPMDEVSEAWRETLVAEAIRRGFPVNHADTPLGEPSSPFDTRTIQGALRQAETLTSDDSQPNWDGGGAKKKVNLPKGDESALGEPSPKFDKGRNAPQTPQGMEMSGTPHPTRQQEVKKHYDDSDKHPVEENDAYDKGFFDQVDATMKSQDLPSAGDDANTTEKNLDQSSQGGTWSGTESLADPVTNDVGDLAAVSKVVEAYDYQEGPTVYTVNGPVKGLSPEEITGLGLDPKNPRPLTDEEQRKLEILRANRWQPEG